MSLLEVYLDKVISQFLLRLNQVIFPINLTLDINPTYQFRVRLKSLLNRLTLLNTLLAILRCRILEWSNPKDIILRKYLTKINNNKSLSFSIFPLMLLAVYMLMVFLMTVTKEKFLISSDHFLVMSKLD